MFVQLACKRSARRMSLGRRISHKVRTLMDDGRGEHKKPYDASGHEKRHEGMRLSD